MYWQKANGEAWERYMPLLADMNSQGQVQMAMNGGIYDELCAARFVHRKRSAEEGVKSRAQVKWNFFYSSRRRVLCRGDKVGIVRLGCL